MWIKKPARPQSAPEKITGYSLLLGPKKFARLMISYYFLPGLIMGLLVTFIFYKGC